MEPTTGNEALVERRANAVSSQYIDSAFKALSERIGHTDQDMAKGFRKIEDQLGQVLVMTRDLAGLEEFTRNQSAVIADVQENSRKQEEAMRKAFEGINRQIASISTNIEKSIKEMHAANNVKMEAIEDRQSAIEKRIQIIINRAIGASAAITICLGAFQYIAMQWLQGIDAERTTTRLVIEQHADRLRDLERAEIQRSIRSSNTPVAQQY